MNTDDDDDDNLEVEAKFGDVEIATLLITLGAGLFAYEHIPYYGAAPIAMGCTLLLAQALYRVRNWWVRR